MEFFLKDIWKKEKLKEIVEMKSYNFICVFLTNIVKS